MPKKSPGKPARTLHLGQTELEEAFYEFQHAIICYGEAFYRYAGLLLERISGLPNLTGADSVILNSIRAGDRPKSIPELQHFTNRSDIANIQYSIKKLIKAGLVQRDAQSQGRSTTYSLTDKGIEVTDAYAEARREFLTRFPQPAAETVDQLNNATGMILHMTGLYDHGARSLTAN